jgi:CRP-like cAMP-binding protein
LAVNFTMKWSNHFLDAQPMDVLEALRPHLKRLKLHRHQPIVDVDEMVSHVVLPIDAVISVIAVMGDGREVESRTIGRESGFGLLHALGSRLAFERVTVQVPGEAWQVPVSRLAELARVHPSLVSAIVGHAQATIVQATQATACNAIHSAEARLCRWLAMTQDRRGGDIVPLTQEHLAIMVGVQRTTITALALDLQARGVINYRRGNIAILDREALQRGCCECYGVITNAAAKVLAGYPASENSVA